MTASMSYIFWTCASLEEAREITQELLKKRWIGCASLFPQVISLFQWEGRVEESSEIKVILKTKPQHFDSIHEYITEKGSYEVPEIVEILPSQVSSSYLSWLLDSTQAL